MYRERRLVVVHGVDDTENPKNPSISTGLEKEGEGKEKEKGEEGGYVRQEQINDVKVERDRRRNLLLDVHTPHDELRIHQLSSVSTYPTSQYPGNTYNIRREQQRARSGINEFNSTAVREEHSDQPEPEQEPQRAVQVSVPLRVVILRLTRPQHHPRRDHARHNHRLQHHPDLIKADHRRDRVRLHHGESPQKQQVRRVRLALPVRGKQQPQGTEHRQEEHPAVGLDEVFEGRGEEGDGGDEGGEEELNGED